MTAADVRDILQLPTGAPAAAPKPKSKGKSKKGKRMDAMTRELYSLMGDNAPSLTLALPKMKERPKIKTKASPWQLTPFKNEARKDGLELKHWTPAAQASSQPYKFAVFDTHSNILSYSEEEYVKLLRDPDWTKEETDYLFDQCRMYDLRFVVIHDRYEWPGSSRTLEDIKDRYYACCRRLIRDRLPPADESKGLSANAYAFDKGREVARKEYLKSLMSRTPAQIAEEEFLYVESRRLEQTYAKTTRERDDLLRMLGGPGSGAVMPHTNSSGATLPAATASLSRSLNSAARRRSARGGTEDDPDLPGLSMAAGGKGKKVKVDPVYDAQHFISRLEPAPATGYGLPRSHNHVVGGPTVCLRSTRLPAIKQALQPRVLGLLGELGISQRLVMPTIVNQDRLEQLIEACATLADMKRQLDRLEYETKVAKARTIASTFDADAEGESVVDEAASVAGTDSGRPRKRSQSVASSHGSTKPPKKRRR